MNESPVCGRIAGISLPDFWTSVIVVGVVCTTPTRFWSLGKRDFSKRLWGKKIRIFLDSTIFSGKNSSVPPEKIFCTHIYTTKHACAQTVTDSGAIDHMLMSCEDPLFDEINRAVIFPVIRDSTCYDLKATARNQRIC